MFGADDSSERAFGEDMCSVCVPERERRGLRIALLSDDPPRIDR